MLQKCDATNHLFGLNNEVIGEAIEIPKAVGTVLIGDGRFDKRVVTVVEDAIAIVQVKIDRSPAISSLAVTEPSSSYPRNGTRNGGAAPVTASNRRPSRDSKRNPERRTRRCLRLTTERIATKSHPRIDIATSSY